MGWNFKEFIAIARYHKGRYFADAKIAGTRGLILTLLKIALIMVGIFIKIMTKITF
jgi:hypothetical protein